VSETPQLTPKDRQMEELRCGICGLPHPFLTVCPFVEEREIRYEFGLDGAGRRRARTRIERTKYFPRPQLFKAIEEATTDSDAAPSRDASAPAAGRRRVRGPGRRAAGKRTPS